MHLSSVQTGFQIGHLHIPLFGVVVAIGLMAALALSQRTARYAGLDPEAVWNAGMAAVAAAFVISRLLLVAFNLHSFLEYPLLILALPSLTTTGVVLTGLFMLAYIRWRKLPLLSLLDAAAPCAALVWAFASLGEFLDGTRDGMPMRRLLEARAPIATAGYPVEIYASLAGAVVCLMLLLGMMVFGLPHTRYLAGQIAGAASAASGLAIFFIDFFRLPSDLLQQTWLDPAQIMGVAMMLFGAVLLMRARTQVRRESGTK